MSDSLELQRFMPYVITVIIWITILIIFSVLYFLFPPEIYYWVKVCDKCSVSNGKYIYVIRFIFGSYKKTFDLSKTMITIEIRNEEQAMVCFHIQPKQLVEHIPNFPNPPLKTVRLLLYRKEPLKDIKNLLVNHNGTGSINVTTIEIQDLNEKEAHIVYIGAPVNSLSKDKAIITQMFPAAQREMRSIEQDLKPSVSLNAKEFVVFVCLAINMMLFLSVYVIPCKQNIICDDYSEGLTSSAYSGLISGSVAAIVMAIGCAFHRYIIKKSLYNGIAVCYYLRYAILLLVAFIALIFGLIAAIMASENRKFPKINGEDYFHEIYWMFAFSIAIMVFAMFWMSLLSVIARLIGFFAEPEEIKMEINAQMMEATARTPDPDMEKEGSDYMTQLIKGNTKVKSISQYGGVNQKKSEAQIASKKEASNKDLTHKDQPASGKDKVKRSASTESTSSGYYKQLFKGHGKVKSISQYKGIGK